MANARHCSSWADLQPELLGLVLSRLPSLADRVRLAAVCRPWRHRARLEPVPPHFPWLTLRRCTFLSIPDGKIYCLPSVPPANSHCHGSVGNWLLIEQHTGVVGGSPQLSLRNPFSKDVMQLPDADTEPLNRRSRRHKMVLLSSCRSRRHKMVLLSSMDASPDSLFAVLTTDGSSQSVISICKPSTASAFRVLDHERICDIAHVDGKLYALSARNPLSDRKLFVLEVESSSKCNPKIPSMECIANDVHYLLIHNKTIAGQEYICRYWDYLVKSSGKLLYVRRLIGFLSALPRTDWTEQTRTFSFDVFEVDLTASSSVEGRQLNSLGGKALFVGPYSKALQASEYGAQADCIYFMCDYDRRDFSPDPFRDSGVFNMRNGTITPLLPETMEATEGIAKGRQTDKFYSACPSWFFPY